MTSKLVIVRLYVMRPSHFADNCFILSIPLIYILFYAICFYVIVHYATGSWALLVSTEDDVFSTRRSYEIETGARLHVAYGILCNGSMFFAAFQAKQARGIFLSLPVPVTGYEISVYILSSVMYFDCMLSACATKCSVSQQKSACARYGNVCHQRLPTYAHVPGRTRETCFHCIKYINVHTNILCLFLCWHYRLHFIILGNYIVNISLSIVIFVI